MKIQRKPFFAGYRPQFLFKKPSCTCALNYFQAIKCPVHSKLTNDRKIHERHDT